MIRGMYASAAGMMTGLARQDLLAANLANADTVGHRRTRCATRAFSQTLQTVGQAADLLRGGEGPVNATLDTSAGPIEPTASKFDLAINGPGYFAVQTPQGLRYTRDGQFRLNATGRLVDVRGNPVVGVNGPMDLGDSGDPSSPGGGEFEVSETGQVRSGGRLVGDLLIAEVPADSLRAEGRGLYSSSAMPQRATGARVIQGSLERSNVNTVPELGAMIENSRYYEANAAALRYQDKTVETLLSGLQG